MIDTEALRKKVIDLAIRGKLTQQFPTDGTAEELYAQIQDEKAKLIKEGKLKKQKTLPGIEPEVIPFEAPKKWKWVKLKDICKKIIDGDHNPPEGVKEKTEYLMLSAKNINNDRIVNIENVRYLTKDCFIEENKRTCLAQGDILLTIVATLGRSCVYRESYNACFQRSVCVISTMIVPEYLKRVFDSSYIQKFMADNATGAAQPGFYLNKVEELCIPLPPLAEQKRIADKIDSVLSEIDIIDAFQSQYCNNLEALKSKIIDAGIRGRLTEQLPTDGTAEELYAQIQEEKARLVKEGKIKKQKPLPTIEADEIPFEIPKNWKWVRLGDMCYPFRYGTSEKSSKTGRVAVLRMGNIQYGSIDYSNLVYTNNKEDIEKYQLDCNDLLFNRTNSREWVGKTALYRGEQPAIFAGYLIQVRPIQVDSEYLNYVMNSEHERNYCKRMKSDSINQSNVNAQKLSLFIVPLPPLEEQKRIAQKINEIL